MGRPGPTGSILRVTDFEVPKVGMKAECLPEPPVTTMWMSSGAPTMGQSGRVVVLFGPRPDLVGWQVVEGGRPNPDVLDRVRSLTHEGGRRATARLRREHRGAVDRPVTITE